jgi:hypothetical protein
LEKKMTTSKLNEKESIVGIRWAMKDGKRVLVQDVRYKDGTVHEELVAGDVTHAGELTDEEDWNKNWEGTNTVPQPLPPSKTGALVPPTDQIPTPHDEYPAMDSPLIRKRIMNESERLVKMTDIHTDSTSRTQFIQEHIDRSLKLHGKLIKWLGGTPESIVETGEKVTLPSHISYEIVVDVIESIGDPWIQVLPFLKFKQTKG